MFSGLEAASSNGAFVGIPRLKGKRPKRVEPGEIWA